MDENTKFLINPSGKFTIWGSFGDSGCVGRKIIVEESRPEEKTGKGKKRGGVGRHKK